MKINLEFGANFCAPTKFEINGVDAFHSDFGDKLDHAPSEAEPYTCGDMQFRRKPPKPCVLAKYAITVPEYNLVAAELGAGLSFGSCGLCE